MSSLFRIAVFFISDNAMVILSVPSDGSDDSPETGNSGFGPSRRRSSSERRSAPSQVSWRARSLQQQSEVAPPQQESEVAPPQESEVEPTQQQTIEGGDAAAGQGSFPDFSDPPSPSDYGSVIVDDQPTPRKEVQENEIIHEYMLMTEMPKHVRAVFKRMMKSHMDPLPGREYKVKKMRFKVSYNLQLKVDHIPKDDEVGFSSLD